jgi:hypothetical protein
MIGHQTNLSRSGQWPSVAKKWCPLLEDFVSLQTLTKCGPNYAPHWRTLSHSGLQPNVAQFVPLIGGRFHAADFDQMWPKLCLSSEDFVTQQTLEKCSPNCAPCWRTLSCSGLQLNVVQNVPLVGGLCPTADFDRMWSKHMHLVGGLCHTADFDQMWSKHVPLDWGLHFAMEFGHLLINNVLIIEKGPYQTNGFESLINAELKPPSPLKSPCDQYAQRYSYQQVYRISRGISTAGA